MSAMSELDTDLEVARCFMENQQVKQRLAVQTLITDCKLLIGAGVIPDSAVIMLASSIRKIEETFEP